jgi:hypothetical protein
MALRGVRVEDPAQLAIEGDEGNAERPGETEIARIVRRRSGCEPELDDAAAVHATILHAQLRKISSDSRNRAVAAVCFRARFHATLISSNAINYRARTEPEASSPWCK